MTHGPSSCSTLHSLSFLLCSPREAVLDDPAFYWLGGPSLVLFASACVLVCMLANEHGERKAIEREPERVRAAEVEIQGHISLFPMLVSFDLENYKTVRPLPIL